MRGHDSSNRNFSNSERAAAVQNRHPQLPQFAKRDVLTEVKARAQVRMAKREQAFQARVKTVLDKESALLNDELLV